MAISKEAQSNSRYRQALIEKLVAFCSTPEIGGSSEWVRQTASNAFAFMFVNDNGDEGTVKITVSFPKGSWNGKPNRKKKPKPSNRKKLKRIRNGGKQWKRRKPSERKAGSNPRFSFRGLDVTRLNFCKKSVDFAGEICYTLDTEKERG